MNASQTVPVLAYHATNVDGNDYESNDHVAFAHDLRRIDALGYQIVAVSEVVDALLDGAPLPDRAVAITFDDGTDLDFRDRMHPTHGLQRGMLNILLDFIAEHGRERQPRLHATAFVIASPEARAELDERSMIGAGWWGDDWWPEAIATGLLGVANHSWDHNHAVVSAALPRSATGTFRCIDSWPLADLEILRARAYIEAKAPNAEADLFAYPFGETNSFLLDEYFPAGPSRTGARAAFSTEPAHLTAGANRWNLPRYVCGAAWRTPEGLDYILAQGR
jgi:Polysaccharide deacetylase